MGLLRTLDLRYNSNMAIIGLMLVGFVVGMGLGVAEGDIGASLGDGLNLMLSLFLAWCIARELEPDQHGAATVAAVVGGAIWMVLDRSAIAAGFVVMLGLRILVRSTGRQLTTIDGVVLIALAAFAANSVAGWVVGLGLAFAIARDVRLPGPTPGYQRFLAFAVAAAATISVFARWPNFEPDWSFFSILVVVAGIVAGLVAQPAPPVTSADSGEEPLLEQRILSARRTGLVVAIFGALTGTAGVADLSPLWAALLVLPIVDRMSRGDRRDVDRATHVAGSDLDTAPPALDAAPDTDAGPTADVGVAGARPTDGEPAEDTTISASESDTGPYPTH